MELRATWSFPLPTICGRQKQSDGNVYVSLLFLFMSPRWCCFCDSTQDHSWGFFILSVVTDQRAEAGARQCHGEGRHGNRAKVKDAGIDVQGGKCLKRGETSGVRW